jgi:uncharacterized LabA/DUF88 family protein
MTRVTVFVDYQNVYMRARQTFGDPALDVVTFGQFHPRRLGLLLTRKGETVDPRRELHEVRIYRGEPDAQRSPKTQAACQRQVRYWAAQDDVAAITRPLLYIPSAWHGGRPSAWQAREKGIDVRIALDMAMGAVRNEFDVAVLVSADTDLVPAIEAVIEAGRRVEVASWRPDRGYGSRLSVPRRNVWCHWLGRKDFEQVSDDTDYTTPSTTRP